MSSSALLLHQPQIYCILHEFQSGVVLPDLGATPGPHGESSLSRVPLSYHLWFIPFSALLLLGAPAPCRCVINGWLLVLVDI